MNIFHKGITQNIYAPFLNRDASRSFGYSREAVDGQILSGSVEALHQDWLLYQWLGFGIEQHNNFIIYLFDISLFLF
jgi:hypothetical protein